MYYTTTTINTTITTAIAATTTTTSTSVVTVPCSRLLLALKLSDGQFYGSYEDKIFEIAFVFQVIVTR